MSDDLVKRLREYGSNRFWPHGPACDCTQAADRIEELEAKLAKAVDVLEQCEIMLRLRGHDEVAASARTIIAELTGGNDE